MANDLWMIEAVIQPFKLDAVTLALEAIPAFRGITVSDCRGFGQEKLSGADHVDHEESQHPAGEARRRGSVDFIDFTTKLKLEIAVVGRQAADTVVDTIARVAHTGRRGDGKIFAWPLARVVRVRTFDDGEGAL